jgi:hypothetical protein
MSAIATLSTGLVQTDSTQATQIARGTIALAGNYGGGATHGDTLNLALYGIQSNLPPLRVLIFETPPAGTAPTGYQLGYAPGTNPSNGQLTIMGGPATEYTEGSAYNAALLAAVLNFEAIFPLGN